MSDHCRALTVSKRKVTRVCAHCWYAVRPTEYLPARGGTYVMCDGCAQYDMCYRVSAAEGEQARERYEFEQYATRMEHRYNVQ